jgi:pilus assembly protein TadC
MNSNQTLHEKRTSKTKEVLKKIGLLLLAAIVLTYIYVSINFIIS